VNVDTNHLIAALKQSDMPDYEKLPDNLAHAARTVLEGRSEAYVSRTSGGKLSRYAAKRRKEKRKEARNARKRNRK